MFTSTPIAGKEPIQRHLRYSIDEHEAIYECDYCAQKFKIKTNLVYHELVHQLNQHERKDSDKPFVCVVCGMRFGVKTELDLHRDVHLEENIQKCGYCKKRYKYDEHFQRHKRIHEWVESLDDVFDCNDSGLIFQSDVVDEPSEDKSLIQHVNPSELTDSNNSMDIEPGNEKANGSKNATGKSIENSESFAISVSSSTSNNNEGELSSSASQQMSEPNKRYNLRSKGNAATNRNTNSKPAHLVIDSTKKDLKCSYCVLKFKESCEKLKHECIAHQPKITLTKVTTKSTKNNATKIMDLNIPTENDNRKESFKCAHSTFNQNNKKLIHECNFHQPSVILTKRIIENITKDSTIGVKIPTEITKQKANMNQRKGNFTNQRPAHKENFHQAQSIVSTIDLTIADSDGDSVVEISSGSNEADGPCKVETATSIKENIVCDYLTFEKNDSNLEHECITHLQPKVMLPLFENDAKYQTTNSGIKEREPDPLIEPDVSVRLNSRKRPRDNCNEPETGGQIKRCAISTNQVAIDRQANGFSSFANFVRSEFDKFPKTEQEINLEENIKEEQENVPNFWRKTFNGIQKRRFSVNRLPLQWENSPADRRRRLSCDLPMTDFAIEQIELP